MNIEETRRSWELTRYFVVLPAFKGIYRNIDYAYPDLQSSEVTRAYHSGNEMPLPKQRLTVFLKENNLLFEDPTETQHPAERHWP